jgi:hypothetical protein
MMEEEDSDKSFVISRSSVGQRLPGRRWTFSKPSGDLSCSDDLILHILRNSSDSGVTPLNSRSSRHTRSEVLWWFIEQAENMVTQ